MLFSEIYSAYYNAVAKIITLMIDGEVKERDILRVISENCYSESMLEIIPAIKSERWQVADKNYRTPIVNPPTMPLTLLQKRWLKSVLSDKRVRLFGDFSNLFPDISPLFTEEDYRIVDSYADGDDFEDEDYIKNFRLVALAVKEQFSLRVTVKGRNGEHFSSKILPTGLEYSEKDDKFRVNFGGGKFGQLNLNKILHCERYDGNMPDISPIEQRSAEVVLRIYDERNALERVLLHFAHLEKRAERAGENTYLVRLKYRLADETEMVIRVLSFGPCVEVTEPARFRELIKNRLISQQQLNI